MSYELIGILAVGLVMSIGQVAAIITTVSGFGAMVREMDATNEGLNRGFEAMDRRFEAMDRRFEEMVRDMNRSFEELSRTHRAIAALVVQESEKIQTLLRT